MLLVFKFICYKVLKIYVLNPTLPVHMTCKGSCGSFSGSCGTQFRSSHKTTFSKSAWNVLKYRKKYMRIYCHLWLILINACIHEYLTMSIKVTTFHHNLGCIQNCLHFAFIDKKEHKNRVHEFFWAISGKMFQYFNIINIFERDEGIEPFSIRT